MRKLVRSNKNSNDAINSARYWELLLLLLAFPNLLHLVKTAGTCGNYYYDALNFKFWDSINEVGLEKINTIIIIILYYQPNKILIDKLCHFVIYYLLSSILYLVSPSEADKFLLQYLGRVYPQLLPPGAWSELVLVMVISPSLCISVVQWCFCFSCTPDRCRIWLLTSRNGMKIGGHGENV